MRLYGISFLVCTYIDHQVKARGAEYVCLVSENIKRQFFSIIACLVVLAAVLATAAVWPSSEEAAPTAASVAASSEEERLSYLRNLGYEVAEPYVEVSEVLIPDEFDEVFQKYNEVQQSA